MCYFKPLSHSFPLHSLLQTPSYGPEYVYIIVKNNCQKVKFNCDE